MLLDTQIKFLKGVGEKRAEQLCSLGVTSINALFHYFPRDYEDWSSPVPILGAEWYDRCCIKVTVGGNVKHHKAKSGITVFEVDAFDDSASIHIVFFNQKYTALKMEAGREYLLFGQVVVKNNKYQILSPSISDPVNKQCIHPVYKRSGKITSNYIEKCVREAFNSYGKYIEDPLPEKLREEFSLMPLVDAFVEIHFPSSMEEMMKARERFMFEELFFLELGLMRNKRNYHRTTDVVLLKDYTDEFLDVLPFTPTGAQLRTVETAMKDMMSGSLMNRLVQGDVGSGKTMVAAALMYSAAKNGYQSAMMAPTEILARQHFETLSEFFKDTDVTVCVLTGSTPRGERNALLSRLSAGEIDVLVGTHALISDGVDYKNLGLVITDEQHRFGVRQRGKFLEKGHGTHVLVMSATPIPRTLAHAMYGDLEVSIIDELPKGRIPIETYKIDSEKRQRAFAYIKKHLDEGRQGYIVCPLVEEGEIEGVLSATEYYNFIKDDEFKDYKLGLLHGQMKPGEKAEVMRRFVDGEIQLLISTVVIEVGVDVPNAVIMLIENAERFGLSQLHQLRGRVGRGQWKSTCILLSDNKSEQTKERLSVMTSTNDGFEIAEQDLKLRGPGDFYGSRQHGFQPFYIRDMLENRDILEKAEDAASRIMAKDPELSHYPGILNEVDSLFSRIETSS